MEKHQLVESARVAPVIVATTEDDDIKEVVNT